MHEWQSGLSNRVYCVEDCGFKPHMGRHFYTVWSTNNCSESGYSLCPLLYNVYKIPYDTRYISNESVIKKLKIYFYQKQYLMIQRSVTNRRYIFSIFLLQHQKLKICYLNINKPDNFGNDLKPSTYSINNTTNNT